MPYAIHDGYGVKRNFALKFQIQIVYKEYIFLIIVPNNSIPENNNKYVTKVINIAYYKKQGENR